MSVSESTRLLSLRRPYGTVEIDAHQADEAEKTDEASVKKDLTVRVSLALIAACILYADRNQPTSTLSLTATSVLAGTGGKGALNKYTVPRLVSYPLLAGIISTCMIYDQTNISTTVFLSVACKDFILAAKKSMKGVPLIDLIGVPNPIRTLFKCPINKNQAAENDDDEDDDDDGAKLSSPRCQATAIALITAAMIASYFIPTPLINQPAPTAEDTQTTNYAVLTLPTIWLAIALIKISSIAVRELPGIAQTAIVAAAASGAAVVYFGFPNKLPVDLGGPLCTFVTEVVSKIPKNYVKGKKFIVKGICGLVCKKTAKENKPKKDTPISILIEGEGELQNNAIEDTPLFSETVRQQAEWLKLYWKNPKLRGLAPLLFQDKQIAACFDSLGGEARNLNLNYTCDKSQKKDKKKKTEVSNVRKLAIILPTAAAAVVASTFQQKGSITSFALCGLVGQLFDKAYIKKNGSWKDLSKRIVVYGSTLGIAYGADKTFIDCLNYQTKFFNTAGAVFFSLAAKKEGRNAVNFNYASNNRGLLCKKTAKENKPKKNTPIAIPIEKEGGQQNDAIADTPLFSDTVRQQAEWLKLYWMNPKLRNLALLQDAQVAACYDSLR